MSSSEEHQPATRYGSSKRARFERLSSEPELESKSTSVTFLSAAAALHQESEVSWAPGTELEESSLVVLPSSSLASLPQRAQCAQCGRIVALVETGLTLAPSWKWKCFVCEAQRAEREFQPRGYAFGDLATEE